MKKALIFILCLITPLVLLSCSANESENIKTKAVGTFTVINDIKEADIWILPETAENNKTTVWGKADVSKIQRGESRSVPLYETGGKGRYILRMIDTDSFFYSANGIELKPDYTLRIKETETKTIVAEASDENGMLMNTYDVFSARL